MASAFITSRTTLLAMAGILLLGQINFCFCRPRQKFMPQAKLNDIRLLFERYLPAFRDPVCPIYAAFLSIEAWSKNDYIKCMPDATDQCKTDSECQRGFKCCFDGCFYTCAAPININQLKAVDYEDDNEARIGLGETIDSMNSGSLPLEKTISTIECSTTNSLDFQPMLCPAEYKCQIEAEEDIDLGLPNRGICVKHKAKVETNSIEDQGVEAANNFIWENQTEDCIYQGRSLQNGDFLTEGCRFCFCDQGSVRCQINRCAEEKSRSKVKAHPVIKTKH